MLAWYYAETDDSCRVPVVGFKWLAVDKHTYIRNLKWEFDELNIIGQFSNKFEFNKGLYFSLDIFVSQKENFF